MPLRPAPGWWDDRRRNEILRCRSTFAWTCPAVSAVHFILAFASLATIFWYKNALRKEQTAIFLDKLSKRDPANYGKPKQRKTTCPSPVPTDAWNTYLLSHSNAKPPPKPPDTLNRNSRHIDARASAVPLGRGRISQGMNRSADAFDCLSLAVMTCLRAWYLNF